jgi:tetratricopeptide (TPR) repeat protein
LQALLDFTKNYYRQNITKMAEEKVTSTDDTIVAAAYSETNHDEPQGFFEENKNTILGASILLVLVVLGLYFFMLRPNGKDQEASEKMFEAQFLFEQDSFRLALDGDDTPGQVQVTGFLGIIEEFSGTKSANLAHYYAGISLLRLGEYASAITYLENYRGKDAVTQAFAYGAIGDAHSELNDMEKALTFYKKAAEYKPNLSSTPYFLRKIGRLLEHQGKKDEAKAYYERVQKEYGAFAESIAIQKDIIRVTGTYE